MRQRRVAIYARVSTTDQSTENQLLDTRCHVAAREWAVTEEYIDHGISGARSNRPELDRLMADARRRRFDVVLVSKFDRFARSAKHLLTALDEFRHLGIDFVSIQDSVDTTTPIGRAMFTIVGAFAELERETIRQRVLDGVQKARERGKRLGRPTKPLDEALLAQLRSLQGKGRSIRQVAATMSMKKSTVALLLSKKSPATV